MDEALTAIVEKECADALDRLFQKRPDGAEIAIGFPIETQLEVAFKEARTSCASMSANDQFRGAILAVRARANAEDRKRLDAELRNIELVARQMRTGEDGAIPILIKPIGLTALWKAAKP